MYEPSITGNDIQRLSFGLHSCSLNEFMSLADKLTVLCRKKSWDFRGTHSGGLVLSSRWQQHNRV